MTRRAFHYHIGCCRNQEIHYNEGVAQSFSTSNLPNFDYVTNIRIDVPMCKTLDFDGNIEVKLYLNLDGQQEVCMRHPVIINNSDIPTCPDMTEKISVDLEICYWQVENTTLYVAFVPIDATAGSIRVKSSTPYSDRYHHGDMYILINGSWIIQEYQDVCMQIYTKSDCEYLGWCEHMWIDHLICARALVSIDLPGYGVVNGKIMDYKVSKSTEEPFSWIPFSLTLEEVNTKNLSC